VIVVNRSTVYYLTTALMFFIAGYIVAWTIFSTTAGNIAKDVRDAAISGASIAISTEMAKNYAQAYPTQPTRTPIPRQEIDPGNSPSWGPADAKVTIIEFTDFECPYCSVFYEQTYARLKKDFGDKVRFVYKDLPLPNHPNAYPAALAANCAHEQGKFWEYHDTLFQNQLNLSPTALVEYAKKVGVADMPKFEDCFKTKKYASVIDANMQLGASKFADATPTFFINGYVILGAQSYELFAQIIEYLMKNP
jgi:protein-disulfide isomerase